MSSVLETSESTFDSEVLQSSVPVLVDVYATWCQPCRMLAPSLVRLAKEFAGRIQIVKINTDAEPGLTSRLNIQAFPTLIFFAQGREIARTEGLVPEASLREALTRLSEAATS